MGAVFHGFPIVELGHYALVLSLAVALAQAIVPMIGLSLRDGALLAVGRGAALAQGALVTLAFIALTIAYVQSDFSVVNVIENSHSLKPLIYKITGVWGNHEGSMLLWVLILAVFGAAVAVFGRLVPGDLLNATLAVQGAIAAAFLGFLLFTSNPFERIDPAPLEGQGLNPVLQDIGLAIHPPLLYLGYVGFSIAFSFAAGALLVGRIDAAWARTVRPWVLVAWVTLTLGIAMGSYWAYYELGWGGYWFWDPVENASLMPWLTGTALMHSALVMEKRDSLKSWTILLSIITFSLSLIGTFIVRSGVLTSVHAFAVDPARGVVILAILVLFIGGSLALYAARAGTFAGGGLFAPISREGALVFNNLFLAVAGLTVFVGTLYPLLLEAATGAKISVGAPYFNAAFLPLMAPLVLLLPFGQQLAWKRGDLPGAAQRLLASAALALIVLAGVVAITKGGPVLALGGIALGTFATVGALDDLRQRAFRGGLGAAYSRAMGVPRGIVAAALAHAGLGLMVIGLSATAFEIERFGHLRPGESAMVGEYALTLDRTGNVQGPNYTARAAHFSVRRGGVEVATLDPAKRVYVGRSMPTSEVGRYTVGLSQLYVAVADFPEGGGAEYRAYWKPFVLLIWIGPVLMALGGLLSLTDRRLRIGAAVRPRAPAGAGKLEPAE